MNETAVPHVIRRVRALSDFIGVVINILHADTIIKRLAPGQTGYLKTSSSVEESIERLRMSFPLGIGPLFLVLL